MIECRGRNKWFKLHKATGWAGTMPGALAHVSLESKKPYGDMPPIYFAGPPLEMLALLDQVRREILEAWIASWGGWWGEHPSYPRQDWMDEAGENDTGLGYWDWVLNKIDQEEPENVAV